MDLRAVTVDGVIDSERSTISFDGQRSPSALERLDRTQHETLDVAQLDARFAVAVAATRQRWLTGMEEGEQRAHVNEC